MHFEQHTRTGGYLLLQPITYTNAYSSVLLNWRLQQSYNKGRRPSIGYIVSVIVNMPRELLNRAEVTFADLTSPLDLLILSEDHGLSWDLFSHIFTERPKLYKIPRKKNKT